jgi:4-diphosphocytidyl-2-C-methyl-D-erythritol kinase
MFTILAPAKINWALSVIRKRSDGYHDILSIVQAIDLYDYLAFEESDNIEIQTNSTIRMENNLVYKAIIALKNFTGIKKGIRVTLKKEIPIGGGLGGGSSDAASTLKALNEFWRLKLSLENLIQIGASIGSDIPFFLNLPICIIEGRGEIVKPLKIDKTYTLLLVKPSFGISTKWAYESLNLKTQLTENYEKINNNIWQLYQNLKKGDIENLYLWNDLEVVVSKQYPEIEMIKKMLIKAGAKVSLMSGSGATVFGLFNDEKEALEASEFFKGYWVKVVKTLAS